MLLMATFYQSLHCFLLHIDIRTTFKDRNYTGLEKEKFSVYTCK